VRNVGHNITYKFLGRIFGAFRIGAVRRRNGHGPLPRDRFLERTHLSDEFGNLLNICWHRATVPDMIRIIREYSSSAGEGRKRTHRTALKKATDLGMYVSTSSGCGCQGWKVDWNCQSAKRNSPPGCKIRATSRKRNGSAST